MLYAGSFKITSSQGEAACDDFAGGETRATKKHKKNTAIPKERVLVQSFTMATESAGWTLPDKWSEDLVDEKGEKLSKRYAMR